MKVLFVSTQTLSLNPGGGRSVVFGLADALRANEVQVDFFDYWKPPYGRYDLIHYFSTEGLDLWPTLATLGAPLVVTPISWHSWSTALLVRRRVRRWLRMARHGSRDRRRTGDPMAFPAMFFPNSSGEAGQLCRAHGLKADRIRIVPHGVDAAFAQASGDLFKSIYGRSGFVACVGRFEYPRKNQLALVEALRDSNVPVVFVGDAEPGHEWYRKQCEGRSNPETMLFLRSLKHDDPLLGSVYAAAAVVALPGLLEAPGLTGLEGGLAGARVVATRNGATREYFGSDATYFDPTSVKSIRRVIEEELVKPKGSALRTRILERFTWQIVAKEQKAAYDWVIEKHSKVGLAR